MPRAGQHGNVAYGVSIHGVVLQSVRLVCCAWYILHVDAAVDCRAHEERFELFQQMGPSSKCIFRADKGTRRRQTCLVRATKRRNTRHSAALTKPASRLLSSALRAPSPRRADETAFGTILRFSIAAGPITAGRGPGRQIIHCHWQAEFSALRHCAPSGFDGTSGFYGGRAGRKERLASPRLASMKKVGRASRGTSPRFF